MNHAMKEPDGIQVSPLAVELPALLVAGGSCSHLCRMPRAPAMDEPVPAATRVPAGRRRGPRTKETHR